MNIQDAFAQARYQLLKQVITALGPERMAKAMTAFVDGRSSWSECFFARAFEGEICLNKNPEQQIQDALGLPTKVAIRFTWTAFDSCQGTGIKRKDLEALCKRIVEEDKMSDDIADFVRSVNFDEFKTVSLDCAVPIEKPKLSKLFEAEKQLL